MSSSWYQETKGCVQRAAWLKTQTKKLEARGTNTQASLSSLRPISSHALHWLNPTSSYRAAHQDTEQSGKKKKKRQSEGANRKYPAQEAKVVLKATTGSLYK